MLNNLHDHSYLAFKYIWLNKNSDFLNSVDLVGLSIFGLEPVNILTQIDIGLIWVSCMARADCLVRLVSIQNSRMSSMTLSPMSSSLNNDAKVSGSIQENLLIASSGSTEACVDGSTWACVDGSTKS